MVNIKFDDQKKEKFTKALERGCSITTACKYVGISFQTYRNHYKEDSDQYDPDFHVDVDLALGERNQKVENALFNLATTFEASGQLGAIKTFLSNLVSDEWADKKRHEFSGPDGEPIQRENTNEVEHDIGEKAEAILAAIRAERERTEDNNEG